ncbi:MAG: signal peptide peptidase SppA [Myxococcales bacterium]|nr:signal peptide peptidase SppA [Myxococcales bacterium]MCB9643448.1 signal peptide peptidase SppA [Myxococcales bacterium]
MIRQIILGALCLSLGVAGVSQPAWAFWDFGTTKKVEKKPIDIALFRLVGAYPDRPKSSGFFSSPKSFRRFLRRIRTAAKTPEVKAVVFRLGGLAVGLAKAEAMHKAILTLRKAGKKTYAMLESGGSADYLVAMACDKVFMPSSGMLLLPGLRSESLYFKKMMDRFGLQGDFVTIGDFKTAPEPFLRESMSDAQRKQVTQLIDDLYQHMISLIVAHRKLPMEKVKDAIDQGLWSPGDAKKAGLIDDVIYLNDLYSQLRASWKGEKVRFLARFAIKKRQRPTSIWSMFSMLLNPKKSSTKGAQPKIAVVYLDGSIYYGGAPKGLFAEESDIWSDSVIRTLDKVRKLKNLRAVVLRVNSPGGSALASDLIWRKLEQLKRKAPLYVSMGNVAASGGYYISMGADAILAQPTTITGSIGIFAGKVVLRGAMEKLGIAVQSISRGKNASMFSAFETFSASERKALMATLSAAYKDFVNKAATGRKMKPEALLKLAGGRVWTGRQALSNGLVDKLGDLQDTIKLAMTRTGLKVRPQIVNFPQPKGFFEMLEAVSSNQQGTLPYAAQRLFALTSTLPSALIEPLRFLLKTQGQKQQVMMYHPVPQIRLR